MNLVLIPFLLMGISFLQVVRCLQIRQFATMGGGHPSPPTVVCLVDASQMRVSIEPVPKNRHSGTPWSTPTAPTALL